MPTTPVHSPTRREAIAEVGVHTPGMEPTPREQPPVVVVCTSDDDLLDHVLTVTAAAGQDPLVLDDPTALRSHWSAAGMILVGADHAARAAALGLPRRAEVYLVSSEATGAESHRWSLPLGAAVVDLPAGFGWLSAAVAELAGAGPGRGRVVAFLGGSGGVGSSTCAAGLAVVAARLGRRVLLVDADPFGGGLDLLLGAEQVPGWRWPRLAAARGQLGDLGGQLPRSDGLDLLSTARTDPAGRGGPAAEALGAVLRSGERTYDLVVVDVPRSSDLAAARAVDHAHLLVVVAAGTVRGLAAARATMAAVTGQTTHAARQHPVVAETGVVVRRGRGGTVPGDAVADALGVTLLGVLPDDPGLPLAAERGEPPAHRSRSPLSRLCSQVLSHPVVAGAPLPEGAGTWT